MSVGTVTHDVSFVELAAGAAMGVRDLAAAHLHQLREEISAEAVRAQTAGTVLASGGTIAAIGMMFILISLVHALVYLLGWPEWVAWCTVGTTALIAGIVLVMIGRTLWTSLRPFPDNTLQSVQETLSWMSKSKTPPTFK